MSQMSFYFFPPSGKADPLKPLVILVHGGALSYRMYRTTIPLLNTHGYEVAAPDLPGHGSSVNVGPFSFGTASQHVASALEKIKQDKPNKIVLVGVSLGAQVVLDLLQRQSDIADAAIVSGASIHPPDDKTHWEMPHMPANQEWLTIMTEDVDTIGMENAQGIQQESFAFRFEPQGSLPPILVVVGEDDVAMAKRDFEELAGLAMNGNARSESRVMEGAWHNHPIDVPAQFVALIKEWSEKVL